MLFVLLIREGRASEVTTQRWHEILPNHYFSATCALCRKISTPQLVLQQVHVDDSLMELHTGNTLALLASPGAMYVQMQGSKRARLDDSVMDICVLVVESSAGGALDFDLERIKHVEGD